jgi:hypothetical protein
MATAAHAMIFNRLGIFGPFAQTRFSAVRWRSAAWDARRVEQASYLVEMNHFYMIGANCNIYK